MLNRLKLENFKAWREADLTLGKVTGFFGTYGNVGFRQRGLQTPLHSSGLS